MIANSFGTSPRETSTMACRPGKDCPKSSDGRSSTIYESLALPSRALRGYSFHPTKRLASGSTRPRQGLPLPTTVLRSLARIARSHSRTCPHPLATPSAGNSPQVVARPDKAWPEVPAGFKVELYATGLDQPRLIRTAPNGDFFVAESRLGEIQVFRGITAAGKPQQSATFAKGLKRPFRINASIRRGPIRNGSMSPTRIRSCVFPIRTVICRHAVGPSTSQTCRAVRVIGLGTFQFRPDGEKNVRVGRFGLEHQ